MVADGGVRPALQGLAAVDQQAGAGHVVRVIGGEERDRGCDVSGGSHSAQWNPSREVLSPASAAGDVRDAKGRLDDARAHGVDSDAVCGGVECSCTGETEDTMLAGGVRGAARKNVPTR